MTPGRCVAKLEYYSFVLNTAIGARNLLPMTLFNLFMFLIHYTWLSITTDILASDLTDKIEPWQFFVGGLYVMYGIMFSLKELVSNLISWITGTTNLERKSNLAPPYFKGAGGSYNPFFKSVWIHIQEVFIAFFSSPTSTKYTMCEPALPAGLEEEDDEKQKSKPLSEVDVIMAKYLNPFATRLPCDWTQMDLLTLFEVECEMRDVMRGAMKKMLAKMRGIHKSADSDEESDEDAFVMDIKPPASAFAQTNSNHSHGQGGCGSCKSHSHQGHPHSAKPVHQGVSISEPKKSDETTSGINESQDL